MIRVVAVHSDGAVDARATREPHWPGGPWRRVRSTGSQRWEHAGAPYPAELWLRASEPYHGAILLEDLTHAPPDAAAAQRILARFAALRLVLLVVVAALPERLIAEEQAIAEAYADALPAGEGERRALSRMIASAVSDRRDIAIHAIEAGHHATRQGHHAGAYWLYRTAYSLGRMNEWRPESLRAAAAIAAAAKAGRAPKAVRTWRRRARAAEQAIARSEREADPDA